MVRIDSGINTINSLRYLKNTSTINTGINTSGIFAKPVLK
jgi:hypothetical protein